jgi:hypothetical protein
MSDYDNLLTNTPTKETYVPQLSLEEYKKKKQAERDEVFALSNETAHVVTGDGTKFQKYLDILVQLDRYAAVNGLLVYAQKPHATMLRDFDYWKEHKCFIRSREKAISILESHEYVREDGTIGTGFDIKKVFDLSQVGARGLYAAPRPRYEDGQLLTTLIAGAPMKISGVDRLPDDLCAATDPETGDITVRKGMAFPVTFSAVAYELAHAELIAAPNLSVDPELATVDEPFPDKEFCARTASYLLCRRYGVETGDVSFENVGRVFDGMETKQIKSGLSQICDAVKSIHRRMDRQLEPQKEEKEKTEQEAKANEVKSKDAR